MTDDELWDATIAQLKSEGVDTDELIKKAADNIAKWHGHPSVKDTYMPREPYTHVTIDMQFTACAIEIHYDIINYVTEWENRALVTCPECRSVITKIERRYKELS